MQIAEDCFKIERSNAYAMIRGLPKDGQIIHQSIYCAVKEWTFNPPRLITLHRRPTKYKVNELYGYLRTEHCVIPYKYIATLVNEYHIENSPKLWERICGNGLFDIWDPVAPYDRFKLCKSDPSKYRILLLRIFEIDKEFDKNEICWPNTRLDRLKSKDRHVKIKEPVIKNAEFSKLQLLLEESISGFRNLSVSQPKRNSTSDWG